MKVQPSEILDQVRQFLCPTSEEFWKAILLFTILTPINIEITDFAWFEELYDIWWDQQSQKILNVSMISLCAELADNTNYEFSDDKILYIVKKILLSIEDDQPTTMSAEEWFGCPHINGAVFLTNLLIKNPKRTFLINCIRDLLIYFKQGFYSESTFRNKVQLYSFIQTFQYEMLMFY